MIVSMVLAASENHVIGKDGDLPWRLPADLRFFKQLTTGHTIIMGRKTFDSIKKPLPNRRNVVITRQKGLEIEGCDVYNSLGEALKSAVGEEEVFIVGGATIYQKALDLDIADRIYLTVVHDHFEGDTFFEVPKGGKWNEVSRERHAADEKNPYDYTFLVRERIKNSNVNYHERN